MRDVYIILIAISLYKQHWIITVTLYLIHCDRILRCIYFHAQKTTIELSILNPTIKPFQAFRVGMLIGKLIVENLQL